MKKLFKTAVAGVAALFVACTSPMICFAESVEHIHEEESEYYLYSDSEYEDRFREYIDSLDSETASLMLQDQELVRYMHTPYFWEEDNTVTTNASRSVSLPLAAYPSGSYFSYNGRSCTCHALSCGYSVPSNYPENRCYISSTSSSGNCKRFHGGIQCAGFAYYVFNQYTGTNCSYNNIVNSSISPSSGSDVYNFLTYHGISVGSVIGGSLSSGVYHYIVVTDYSPTGISYYQANYGGNCKVTTATKTWAEFANWYDTISTMYIA